MPEVRVQPRSVYEHHIFVQKANTTLSWTFSTKKKSICFGLYYRPITTNNHSTRASLDEEHHPSAATASMKKRNLSLPKLSHLRTTTTTTNKSNNADAAAVELPTPTTPTTSTTMNYYSDSEETQRRRKRHSMVSASSIKEAAAAAPSSVHSRSRRKSSSAISVINLLDNDFVELIPIDQVNSSKEAITGSYLAEDPGNYVLIFGWAKRWFELSSTGVLSYSVRSGDIKRGSLQIMLATIAIAPKQRTLHIDSGTTTFHLKALSADDFDQWLNCVRKQRSDTTWQQQQQQQHHQQDSDTMAQSAISLLPDIIITQDNVFEQNHHVIVAALHDIDAEIRTLALIARELGQVSTDSTSNSSESLVSQQQQQQQQQLVAAPPLHSHNNSSKLMRFPFMRGSSSNSITPPDDPKVPHQASLDKLQASIRSLTEQRDRLSAAYHDNYENAVNPLEIPSRTGTGFLSHRTASFYSYSAHSEQFFDAEDVLLNEDNESTYGSIVVDSEDEEDHDDTSRKKAALVVPAVQRRSRLPHPVAVRSISVLGILRKNIGKDLSTISMPISLNEPINLLQRLCEELEYTELLDKAATLSSSMDRLMYVAAFAISGYAATQYRIGRKPFNPLMSETYECIRPDRGFRFLAEKVSHYPNVMACVAESKTFTYRQTYLGKTKFWGKSLELITEGQTHITLHQDEYTYSRPSSWLRNLVTGTKYLEHIGEMKVQNHATGEYAVITFKEAAAGSTSFFSSASNSSANRNNVAAKFYDCRGSLIRHVEGKWSDSLSEVVGPDQYAIIWRCKPPVIPDYTDYYGLTSFAMELNEITSLEHGKLPSTDTRCRPDQRLFEQGHVQDAEEEKVRIEQGQRERRKHYEAMAKPWKPLWFERVKDAHAPDGESWQYKGGYWESRETGQWPREMLQLW
ncbi:hypothetical protein MBANPS3_005961 [Mucor bainieri]